MRVTIALILAIYLWPLAPMTKAKGLHAPIPDTIPEHVVRRVEEAFSRHDAKAMGALYAPTSVVSLVFSDSSKNFVMSGPDSVAASYARYWASQKKPPTLAHLMRISAGRFVAERGEAADDNGPTPFIDVYEVRGGLIVHEWQLQNDR